jgi:hypothetical protein
MYRDDRYAVGKQQKDALDDTELGSRVTQRSHIDAKAEIDSVVGKALEDLYNVGSQKTGGKGLRFSMISSRVEKDRVQVLIRCAPGMV